MAHLIAHRLATAMLKLRRLTEKKSPSVQSDRDRRTSRFPRVEHTPTPWSLYFH